MTHDAHPYRHVSFRDTPVEAVPRHMLELIHQRTLFARAFLLIARARSNQETIFYRLPFEVLGVIAATLARDFLVTPSAWQVPSALC